jgi:hypothetical protein
VRRLWGCHEALIFIFFFIFLAIFLPKFHTAPKKKKKKKNLSYLLKLPLDTPQRKFNSTLNANYLVPPPKISIAKARIREYIYKENEYRHNLSLIFLLNFKKETDMEEREP